MSRTATDITFRTFPTNNFAIPIPLKEAYLQLHQRVQVALKTRCAPRVLRQLYKELCVCVSDFEKALSHSIVPCHAGTGIRPALLRSAIHQIDCRLLLLISNAMRCDNPCCCQCRGQLAPRAPCVGNFHDLFQKQQN